MKSELKPMLGQQLRLTPHLLQSIGLLQLTGAELEREIDRCLELNPLLERDDEPTDADIEGDSDGEAVGDAEAGTENADEATPLPFADHEVARNAPSGNEDDDPLSRLAAPERRDVRARVLDALALELHDEERLANAAWLVDRIDDTGYLEAPFDQLADAARAALDITPATLESVRQQILRGEPVGYGARDLRECLRVQLDSLDASTPDRALAIAIVDQHLDLLGQHDHDELASRVGAGIDDVIAAERLILCLDPKPGLSGPDQADTVIVPDVLVRRRGTGWQVSLTRAGTPRIRVNPLYERLLERGGAANESLRGLLQEARALSRGVAVRGDTLLRTAQEIVLRQDAFLRQGEEAMQPLTLREIAEAIGVHESTVSRITTGKFLQTPRGTFELKYFFAARLDGASVAGLAVRAMVKRLIESENPRLPLDDEAIVTLLARHGVRVSRRTVAKYRGTLHIGSAKERRRPQRGNRTLDNPVTFGASA